MDIKEITKDVYYVGVNDRTTTLFESLWPLPKGVSYNSYLVKGEKVALIDTVKVDKLNDFLDNLEVTLHGRKIDYLVINHMEPDHSGAIREMLIANPEMKIVGNRQTIGMVKGFYDINDPEVYLEVKDGDEIDLGGKTLRFYLTPMVHWPETMMTYLEEEGVLFSGDAFGTFGALDGGITDHEIAIEPYVSEMYRYYSNIVGKYGKFVQRALAKIKDLRLEYVCSTHGPVWHERLGEIYDIVDRLSRYESEEGVVIIYGSMYGNTERVAEILATDIKERGVKCIKMFNASYSSMSEMISAAFRYNTLVVASPTYSMRLFPPIESFMIAMETREVKNKLFASFGNYAWAPIANKMLQEYAGRLGWEICGSMLVNMSAHESKYGEIDALAAGIVEAMEKAGTK